MPVQIIADSSIRVNILLNTPNFNEIIKLCKKHHCTYNPNTQHWTIQKAHYRNFIEELEEVDRINLSEATEERIEALLKPPIICKPTNIRFSEDELKVPHKKGKHPHEDYQLDDLTTAIAHNYHGLLQEQGCGKSWLMSSVLTLLKKHKGIDKLLLITSSSGVLNLAKELVKFTDYTDDDIAIGGVSNRRPFDDVTKKIIVCNYRSFLLVSDEYQKDMKGARAKSKAYRKTPIPIDDWLEGKEGVFMLDESHNIGNPSSRQSKVIHALSPYFEYRYIASGTPADEESKYYSQLKFLDHSLVHNMSFSDWKQYYCELGTAYGEYDIKCFKPERLRELASIVRKHSTRRFAEDVLDIPENTIKKVYVQNTEQLQTLYQAYIIEELRKLQAKSDGAIEQAKLQSNFMGMTSVIDDPDILLNNEGTTPTIMKMVGKFNFDKHHPKVEILDDIIEKHPNEKIVIWTARPTIGNKLHDKYADSLVINGSTPVPKGLTLDKLKDNIVEEFRTSKTKNKLIAGIQVLNSSVTATEATVNIYFDTGTNYTQFYQSMKRIHRIGQTKKVVTYIILIDKSIDVTRYKNIEDRDFINKHFGTEKYLSLKSIQDFFNMRGEL